MSIITDQRLLRLWEDAQTKDEWATTRLWEYIFRTEVFKGREWVIASQQPPTQADGDLRRVDVVIEQSDDRDCWTPMLFVEAKAARASPGDIAEVEHQALTACCAYVIHHSVPRVCAMTCFGGKARLWYYENVADYLVPFVPEQTALAAREEYIEANSTDGHKILDGLKYIRDHHVPPISILSNTSTPPRPSNGEGSSQTESGFPARVEFISPDRLVFVKTWQEKGEKFCFRTEKGLIETKLAEWREGETEYNGKIESCSFYTGKKSGTVFCDWILGSLAEDPNSSSTKGKGRH